MARTHTTEEHFTSAVTSRNDRRDVTNGFPVGPLRGYIIRPIEYSSIQLVQWSGVNWLVGESVREPLRFSPCALLLLEAGV
jgi:hypothetical protein